MPKRNGQSDVVAIRFPVAAKLLAEMFGKQQPLAASTMHRYRRVGVSTPNGPVLLNAWRVGGVYHTCIRDMREFALKINERAEDPTADFLF